MSRRLDPAALSGIVPAMDADARWRRCSSCKTDIGFGATYWVCSVSTCNQRRTGLAFCSTECWDAHLGLVRHRESFAVEKRAPSREEHTREQRAAPAPTAKRTPERRIARPSAPSPRESRPELPRDILIVASKLKQYVRARSGMNTSDRVMEVLSDKVRALADAAIDRARRADRKTLLDRDF
jgi:hypothetical protein